MKLFKITLFIIVALAYSCRGTNKNQQSSETDEVESIQEEIAEIKRMFPQSSAEDIPEVRVIITEIRDEFLKKVEDEGYKNPYTPGVEILFSPQLMSFAGAEDDGLLIAPTWGLVPDGMKNMMNAWVEEAGSNFSGEEFFKKNFNWFLVPHELGHFLSVTQPQIGLDYDNYWDGEVYANKVAVSFWLSQGMEAELEEFIAETTKVMNYLGSPTPEGEDEKKFFNENYESLGSDPSKYGYYQFRLYKEAFDQRESLDRVVLLN